MRFRNTLLLLFVLAGLAAYVYYVERPAAEKEATKEKLVELEADDITEIALTYPDREIVVVKAGGVWKLTKPVEAEADDVAVKGILSMLETAEVKKGLEGEVTDLAPYGLDKPSTTVALKAGEKTLPVVKVGKAAPIGGNAYAARGEEKKVLLTMSSVRAGVDKTVKDLRNKSIFRFSDDAVQRLEVKSESGNLVLAKSGDKWKIEAPGTFDADATTVRSYLSTLRALRATDFPDEKTDLATYGLAAPRVNVTLTLGEGGAQQTLLVGSANDKKEVYVKTASSPVVYTVGDWVSRDLVKPVDDFRDKSVLAFDKEKAKSIAVSRQDGESYTLTRADDGRWSIEPAQANAAQGALSAFVNDVAALKGFQIAADDAADLAPYGLEPPALSIAVKGADGADIGTLLLGQRDAGGKQEHTAAHAGGNTVFLVRDFNFTRLDRKASDFQEKPPPVAGAAPPEAVLDQLDMGEDEEDEDGYEIEVEETEE